LHLFWGEFLRSLSVRLSSSLIDCAQESGRGGHNGEKSNSIIIFNAYILQWVLSCKLVKFLSWIICISFFFLIFLFYFLIWFRLFNKLHFFPLILLFSRQFHEWWWKKVQTITRTIKRLNNCLRFRGPARRSIINIFNSAIKETTRATFLAFHLLHLFIIHETDIFLANFQQDSSMFYFFICFYFDILSSSVIKSQFYFTSLSFRHCLTKIIFFLKVDVEWPDELTDTFIVQCMNCVSRDGGTPNQ